MNGQQNIKKKSF